MAMRIERHSVVSASKRQLSAELDGGAVIMDISSGVYYGLNPVAAQIWRMLDQPRTVDQIMTGVLESYDVNETTAEQDVVALVEQLRSWGLVSVQPAANS